MFDCSSAWRAERSGRHIAEAAGEVAEDAFAVDQVVIAPDAGVGERVGSPLFSPQFQAMNPKPDRMLIHCSA